jgi:NAD(P)-dependent dehydrogenase (short-subunit alcohol dehydrogenase family)
MDVKRSAVLITGARRIGIHVARYLAEQGASVCVTYKTSKNLTDVAKEMRSRGLGVWAYPADVRNASQIRQLFDNVEQKIGVPNILINMASCFAFTSVEKLAEKEFDDVIDADLKGSYLCSLEFAKRRKKDGLIINFTDASTLSKPFRNALPYHIAKGGVKAMTDAMAVELAPRIRVNAIAAGFIIPRDGMSKKSVTSIARQIPLGCWGGVYAIVKAVCYLIEAKYVTGSTMFVDGGDHLSG